MSEEKNLDALKTIGEVAYDVGVATHVLRFWESKFKQIKPQKRRGRRYYSSSDVAVIKNIKQLLYAQGYTIPGVQKFLQNLKKQDVSAAVPATEAPVQPNIEHGAQRDLFGNIILGVDASHPSATQFGAGEIAKLKQILVGICSSRNKLNEVV